MALQNVLSAIRTLILDANTLPESIAEREVAYREWFPELSTEEREDLAKIPNDKLRIYTATIFTGESKIIQNHFKLTLKAVIPAWDSVYGEPWHRSKFTKKIHATRPWKSYETQAFIDSVRDALLYDMPELLQRVPDIADLATMEALAVEVKRAPEVTLLERGLSLEELQTCTVDDLLSLDARLAPSARFLSVQRDVIDAYVRFHRSGIEPSLPLPEHPIHAVGSRTSQNFLRWTKLPQGVVAAFAGSSLISVEQIANVYASLDESKSEQDLFTLFTQDLALLMQHEAIYLLKS